MAAELQVLIRRLTPTAKRIIEAAAGRAVSLTHYEILPEHVLEAMLRSEDGDAAQILNFYDQDRTRLLSDVEKQLQYLRSGCGGRPQFSPSVATWLEDAFMTGALYFGYSKIRSGVLLYQLVQNPGRYSAESFEQLDNIDGTNLKRDLVELLSTTVEGLEAGPDSHGPAAGKEGGAPRGDSALAQFCTNFTEKARKGEIDPIFGRDREVRQMIDILSRRRKNNPIVVGEPGVGKTALIEGLALQIVEGDVPQHIKNCDIHGLDLGLLQAGASVKGEFENRLKAVISEVKASVKPIILFIDEAHQLIGAGGQKGGSDASNLLKPALARGELKTIAATTWAEYKKYFEKDAALERRFQPVKVDEPSVDTCVVMLRGLRAVYEKSHNVRIRDEAIVAAAELSDRYISGRQLPDKAIDLLDMTGARVRTERHAKPEGLVAVESDIAALQRKADAIQRDIDEGETSLKSELDETNEELVKLRTQREQIEKKWEAEKEILEEVIAARIALEQAQGGEAVDQDATKSEAGKTASDQAGENATVDVEELKTRAREAAKRLEEIGGEDRLVHSEVDRDAVARTVSSWTGIPLGKMQRDTFATMLNLEDELRRRVIGQEHAIRAVSETVRISTAGIRNPNTPIGVLLFVGTSGVGKTETALALADLLYGGERFMTTINMSEFQEKHTVSRLIGSPPGYVGYGEGGVLTEAVRQRPYSVVLLDECEKADIEVMELFYQVFDKGVLNDGEGREIDFKNTLIILTSNIGSAGIMEAYQNGGEPTAEEVVEKIRPEMSGHFQPALLARMSIVPYRPLDPENMKKITALKINSLRKRIEETHSMKVHFADELINEVARRCTEAETGARNVDHILRGSLMPRIARDLLELMAEDQESMPPAMEVSLGPDGDWRIDFEGM